MVKIEGVIWDFGGVITESPFEAFNRFEMENEIPLDFIRSINAKNSNSNAWALFESSKVTLEEFDNLFYDESRLMGHAIRGKDVVPLLSCSIRKKMLGVLSYLAAGYKQLCLTNNINTGIGMGMSSTHDAAKATAEAMEFFDDVIESSKVGFRKPEKEIYQLACDRLALSCEKIVYLDDLGVNLKPARLMGIKTIKVQSEEQAINDLGEILGLDLNTIVSN